MKRCSLVHWSGVHELILCVGEIHSTSRTQLHEVGGSFQKPFITRHLGLLFSPPLGSAYCKGPSLLHRMSSRISSSTSAIYFNSHPSFIFLPSFIGITYPKYHCLFSCMLHLIPLISNFTFYTFAFCSTW